MLLMSSKQPEGIRHETVDIISDFYHRCSPFLRHYIGRLKALYVSNRETAL